MDRGAPRQWLPGVAVVKFDEYMAVCDADALCALHSLSDAVLYTLPEKLQSAELRRRIILRASKCTDDKLLAEVIQILTAEKARG